MMEGRDHSWAGSISSLPFFLPILALLSLLPNLLRPWTLVHRLSFCIHSPSFRFCQKVWGMLEGPGRSRAAWCVIGLNFGPLLSVESNKQRQSQKLENWDQIHFISSSPKSEGTHPTGPIGWLCLSARIIRQKVSTVSK